MRSDAGCTAPTGSDRVKLISASARCETCLMMDTCAGGGICSRGSDQTAQKDTTVATTQFVTAQDDSAHGSVDESISARTELYSSVRLWVSEGLFVVWLPFVNF